MKRQSPAAALVGSLAEAWAEVRIHKTRVLLSLIGVAVAVAAITSVAGLGGIAEQAVRESSERSGGRPAMLSVFVSPGRPGGVINGPAMGNAFDTVTERYKITYHSSVLGGSREVQFGTGAAPVYTTAVDVDYQVMHRVAVSQGSWFVQSDERRLAPALVVNDVFWQRIGSPDLRTHPTVSLLGPHPVSAVVIGISGQTFGTDQPAMYMLPSGFAATSTSASSPEEQQAQFEAWVPPSVAKDLEPLIKRDMVAAAGSGAMVQIQRNDYLAFGGDQLGPIKIVVGGIAGLVLFLGALSLVNISLVTVRQRIREIGIRRSFGATAGRVFFAVMMESVVATLVAGAVGVAVSIAIVENPWVQGKISQGNTIDLPPFPIEAAILGLVCAMAVGVLAGLLPAVAAVRFKVIDAIRY
ncbi:MAG: Cell division protein FtsX [Microbacteriaceae bacterium]|nr:Cell division protein FtsX [Microbacteriaceae bacterium]